MRLFVFTRTETEVNRRWEYLEQQKAQAGKLAVSNSLKLENITPKQGEGSRLFESPVKEISPIPVCSDTNFPISLIDAVLPSILPSTEASQNSVPVSAAQQIPLLDWKGTGSNSIQLAKPVNSSVSLSMGPRAPHPPTRPHFPLALPAQRVSHSNELNSHGLPYPSCSAHHFIDNDQRRAKEMPGAFDSWEEKWD